MTISAGATVLPVPQFVPDEKAHRKAIADWMQTAAQGKLACVGNVTLTANATSTTVADVRAGQFSFISLTPITANAASAITAGNVWISTQGKKTFTIAHPTSASSDKTFRYAILG